MFTKYLAVFLRRSYKANGLQRKVLISSGRRFLCFCGAKWHRNFKSCLYPERPLSAAYFFVECAEVFQRGTPVCVHLRQLVTRKCREDVLKVATSACKSSVCENTTLTTFIWKKVWVDTLLAFSKSVAVERPWSHRVRGPSSRQSSLWASLRCISSPQQRHRGPCSYIKVSEDLAHFEGAPRVGKEYCLLVIKYEGTYNIVVWSDVKWCEETLTYIQTVTYRIYG